MPFEIHRLIRSLLKKVEKSENETIFLEELTRFFQIHSLEKNKRAEKPILALLERLVLKGWKNAASRIYELGLPISPIFLQELPILLGETPLMQACRYNLIPIIAVLVEGADLFKQNESGLNALMQAHSLRAAKLLCEEADRQNCLEKFLSQKSRENKAASDYARETNQKDIVEFLKELDFKLFNQLIHNLEEEEIIIKRLKTLFISYNSYSEIVSFVERTEDFDSSRGVPLSGTLLGWAIWVDYLSLARELIENYKADLEKTISYDEEFLDGQTPLALAFGMNNIKAVELLLEYKANVLCKTSYGFSLFHISGSAEIINLIAEAARKEDKLEALLSSKIDNTHLLLFHLEDKNFLSLNCLYNLMNPQNYLNWKELWSLLSTARSYSWIYSEERAQFDEFCDHLRALVIIPHIEYLPSKSKPIPSHPLFKNAPIQNRAHAKHKAIQQAIQEVDFLFSNPESCLPYFQFLNSQLISYYQTTYNSVFPHISSNYSFRRINGLLFPIPNKDFEGISMHSVLNSVLQAIFKKYELGERVVKWIGFIPTDIADEVVKKGWFAVESGIGASLIHGKITHMLQLLLIIYAWEDKKICNYFTYEDIDYSLSLQEILEGYITLNNELNPELGNSLWQATRDKRSLVCQISDPSCLNSLVMYLGAQYKFGALADYLINSFCKAFLKYYQAYKEMFPEITIKKFYLHMSDVEHHQFLTPPELLENDIRKAQFKTNSSLFFTRGENYAIAEKKFSNNPNFTPQHYVSL